MSNTVPTLESSEITYRTACYQAFFDDDVEVFVKVGWPEDQTFDIDIYVDFPQGRPEWANTLTDYNLYEMVAGRNE